MEYSICTLKPKTPFHIGFKEEGLETTLHHIPSDTFFSAFCNMFRMLYGVEELTSLLQAFQTDPPFLFSSVFPATKNASLFPLPKNVDLRELGVTFGKQLKYVEYVDKTLFLDIINNQEIDVGEEDTAQGGRVLAKNNADDVWVEREVPRVVTDRITHTSSLYYFKEVVFCHNLHVLIDFRVSGYEQKVKAVLRALGDEGLGGDRSYGRGHFAVDGFTTMKFPDIEGSWFGTLSLVHPTSKDIQRITQGYFEFLDRGGWAYSVDTKGTRRQMVRMFSEGSVFNSKISGDLVAVGGGVHVFYRYGFSFPFPVEVIR